MQSDGKILVGGNFTGYQGTTANRIIRLNSDSSIDGSFDLGDGFDNTVNTLAVQSDSKILIGGNFSNYQGTTANRIIRLNSDGNIDTSFNIGTGFTSGVRIIRTLTVQSDGKILIGGDFTGYQETTANRIIRLNSDGSRDSSFNIGTGFSTPTRRPGVSYGVNTIATQSDGKILVGGNFIGYNEESVNNIIRLNSNGSRDSSFNLGTGFSNHVNTLTLQSDGKILIGGDFITYQGTGVYRIVRLNSNGAIDVSFNIGTGFDNVVRTLAMQSDGKILVGGNFTVYQGTTANRIVRLNSNGAIDVSFNIGTGFDNVVRTLAVQSDGKILIGGDFSNYQGTTANRIIRLNSDGSIDGSFNIGNGFNAAGFVSASGVSGQVNTLTVQSDGKIIVGGFFTSYNGTAANHIIRLNSDGSIDGSFNIGTGFNNVVQTLDIQSDGKIIVGGIFTIYNEVSANRIVRLNSNGGIDSSFNIGTGFNTIPSTLALQSDGKIILGGLFTGYNGVSASRIIRLNSDGSVDSSFNIGTGFSNNVRTLALQSDGKIIVGGIFTSYNGVSANRIIRLNSDGSIDSSFNIGVGFNTTVDTLTLQSDGKIIVGGSFTNYQNQPAGYLIRLWN